MRKEATTVSTPTSTSAVPQVQPRAPTDEQLLMEALEEWDDEQLLSPALDATTYAVSSAPGWTTAPAPAAAAINPKPVPVLASFDLSVPFRDISLADQIAAISQQHVTPKYECIQPYVNFYC